ncbi:MAG: hypothetical protein HY680_02945 [Chloroflexi bacterium]|nr:hypothetical protein [Chloroflexota bacterium]
MNQPVVVGHLSWDPWNEDHIARHDVTREEVEQVCRGRYIVREGHKGRIVLVGPTERARVLAVVLEPRGKGSFYPMTAYTASRRMRITYVEETRRGAP